MMVMMLLFSILCACAAFDFMCSLLIRAGNIRIHLLLAPTSTLLGSARECRF
jgi:hypothetical protein